MKTLETPVLDRILDPVGRILTPDVARALVKVRVDRKTQVQIDRLARKCNAGKLTESERAQYESFVSAIDFLAILQAKARKVLARSSAD